MLHWLKRKHAAAAPGPDLRELLFGDMPPAAWAASGAGEPWVRFRTAADALARGDRARAEQALAAVLAMPGLEARHYLEAWTALRGLGIMPAAEAKHVYGVVLDVPANRGRDTLAAYEDGSARYLNYSGRAVVWDAPGTDAEIDARVGALLAAGGALVTRIGAWPGARPPLRPGQARISLLTPSGLHFGEGALAALSGDPLAAPVFGAGAALMQALTQRASRGPGPSAPTA